MKELMGDMTQQQFADVTGISQSSICKILNNQCVISANNIKTIADKFDVSADWLLGRTNERISSKSESISGNITYGEIFRVITFLLKEYAMTAWPGSYMGTDGQYHDVERRIQSLSINDEILQSMFFEWFQTKSVSQDIYDGWIESRVSEYSKIPYIPWDLAIAEMFKNYHGNSDVSPKTLADFQRVLCAFFKERNNHQDCE